MLRSPLFILALVASCTSPTPLPSAPAPRPAPRGAYLGQTASAAPQVFAPGVVSRRFQELNAAFSPAGDELMFTLADPMRTHYTLVHTVRDASGTWSEPAVVSFSGRYADADPFFTADGARVYFISQRPVSAGGEPRKDFDIWYVNKRGAGWGEPVHLGAPVNSDADEFYVSLTRTGTLYFSRDGDIHRAAPSGDTFQIEKLGPAVNGDKSGEGDPFVAPDESYLIFTAGGRPDSIGSADLYVSFRVDGAWQPARSLGPMINSEYFEYCPIVSPDGAYFFFTSYKRAPATPAQPRTIDQLLAGFDEIDNGLGNIYWIKADFLEAMRAGGAAPSP